MVKIAADAGVPTPTLSAALNYLESILTHAYLKILFKVNVITLAHTLTKEMIVQVLSILNGTKKNNNVSHETKKSLQM